MRVLLISHSTALAGAPLALLHIAEGLSQRHEVAVMLPSPSGPLAQSLTKAGIRTFCNKPYYIKTLPTGINPFKLAYRLIRNVVCNRRAKEYLAEVLDEFKPDIVHSNVGPLDIASGLCAERSIPHVRHLREYVNLPGAPKVIPSLSAFKASLKASNEWNIAITKGIFDYYGLSERDRVIYDGVLPSDFTKPTVAKQKYFICVGRVEKAKACLEVLKAWRSAQKFLKGYKLVFVGKSHGLYALKCRIYAKAHGLNVDFPGICSDIYAKIAGAAALVAACPIEGFGFTTAEAMACGTLVVGIDRAGTKEQMDNAAEIALNDVALRFENRQELASRMKQVAAGSVEFAQMTAQAEEIALKLYNNDRSVEELEKFYKDILNA